MQGISSSAVSFGKDNKYKYNGIELDTVFAVDEYEAQFRDLDPQTGRWWQIDPKIENGMESLSPYASMYDDPILKSDPLGDEPEECCKDFFEGVVQGVKDGWSDTKGFVKSLGTAEGWKNLATGINNLSPMSPMTPEKLQAQAQMGENIINGVKNIPNMSAKDWGHAVGYGLEKTAEAVVLSKGAGMVSKIANGAKAAEAGNEIGILRDAAKGKGNFGIGQASAKTSDKLGKAWVGDGYKVASDGKTLVSENKLRQYRPPSVKSSPHATTGVQSNFEWRNSPKAKWQGNGHLNVQ